MLVTGTNVSLASFPGSESGVAVTMDAGSYTVREQFINGYNNSFSADCTGTIAAGQTKTCTITNDDPAPGITSGGGGGGGGGVVVVVSGPNGSVAGVPNTPAPRVLGTEDVNTDAGACVLVEPEAAFITPNVLTILQHLGAKRDTNMETKFSKTLVPRVVPANLTGDLRAMVENYTNYGTRTGVRLGQGERAGVVDSYRAVYGQLPTTDCDWQNAVRIAMAKTPLKLNAEREKTLEASFKKVYGRNPDRTVPEDNLAIHIMAYGVRPEVRSLKAELAALKIFKKIFGKLPQNATEWDINRAIAYSGVKVTSQP